MWKLSIVCTPQNWPRARSSAVQVIGLVVGVEDEVAAGGHLDPVAARLEAVEEEPLGDAVLRGRGLDRDVVVDEQVGGAQALLARVDPEGEVVQAAAGAVVVGDVDQLVRGDREADPGALLGAVVELDPLVQPVAEELLAELAARADVGGEDVDVVEPLDAGAAAGVALRLVAPRRLQVLGGDVALGLVVELETVAVGVLEAVGRPVSDVPVDPAAAEARLLDRRDAALERLGAPGAQREVAEAAPAATRSASGCSAGSRPSRGGRPTARRAPPPPSRARRRRSAGSRRASA